MLPARAFFIAATSGLGFLSSKTLPAMIMPGVQKPHCIGVGQDERLLYRVRLLGRAQSLDCRHRSRRQGRSPSAGRTHRLSVHDNRACATLALPVTRLLSTSQPKVLTQQVDENPAGSTVNSCLTPLIFRETSFVVVGDMQSTLLYYNEMFV